MRIADLYARGGPVFSFEFFPPKTDEGYQGLYAAIGELKRLGPGFVSVTWGAGGSTRRKTVGSRGADPARARAHGDGARVVHGHDPATRSPDARSARCATRASRTCSRCAATRRRTRRTGVPRPAASATPTSWPRSCKRALRLCIGGACYPEKHPEAPSAEADLAQPEAQGRRRRRVPDHAALLRRRPTTVAFVDARARRRHRRADRAGHHADRHAPRTCAAWRRCRRRSNIPAELAARARAARRRGRRAALEVGVRWATRQCRELLDRGAPGIHFYTLNRSPATRRVHEALFRR